LVGEGPSPPLLMVTALRAATLGAKCNVRRVRVMECAVGRRACLAEAAGSEVSRREGGSNSVVESQPSKLLVAGSIPVSRSSLRSRVDDEYVSYGRQARLAHARTMGDGWQPDAV
jgi:hypothetical protein